MGCWNETCGITQMPIQRGDPVRMFLIVQNTRNYHQEEGGLIHYSTDLWRPFGLPLSGTYDEYGGLEDIKQDILTNYLLESIKEYMVEYPDRMGEEIYKEGLTLEKALNRIADGSFRVTDPYHMSYVEKQMKQIEDELREKFPDLPLNGWSSERSELADKKKNLLNEDKNVYPMYHMMVHEDVYQAIISNKMPGERYGENFQKRLRKDAASFLVSVRDRIEANKNLSEEEKMIASLKRGFVSRMDFNNLFVSAASHLDGSSGSGDYLKKYLNFIENKIEAGAPDDDPEIQNLTEQFIGFIQFSHTLSSLRKMWQPQCGKGGQDAEYRMFKFLAKITTNICNKKIKEEDD